MSVGKNFFDQYSVFCVFGSVVGCVVVPLIAQSVECVIFSALVISLTAANHLNKKNHGDHNGKANSYKDNERKRLRDINSCQNQKRKKERLAHQQERPAIHHRKEFTIERQWQQMVREEEQRTKEMETRVNQKKMKKAKKREERLQRKETQIKDVPNNQPLQQQTDKRSTTHNNDSAVAKSKSYLTNADRQTPQREQTHKDNNSRRVCSRPPRLEGVRMMSHHHPSLRVNTCDPVVSNKSTTGMGHRHHPSSPLPIPVCLSTRSSLSASNSSLSSVGSSNVELPPPSPPVSCAWKLPPQNVEPVWFQGKVTQEKHHSHRTVTDKTTGNDQCKRKKNQPVESSSPKQDAATPLHADGIGYSSLFCTTPGESSMKPTEKYQVDNVGEYSLFGPTRLDSVLCPTPSLLIK